MLKTHWRPWTAVCWTVGSCASRWLATDAHRVRRRVATEIVTGIVAAVEAAIVVVHPATGNVVVRAAVPVDVVRSPDRVLVRRASRPEAVQPVRCTRRHRSAAAGARDAASAGVRTVAATAEIKSSGLRVDAAAKDVHAEQPIFNSIRFFI